MLPKDSSIQLHCPRCGHPRKILFDHIAGKVTAACPRGHDGNGAL